MDFSERAVEVIKEAESKLRDLMSQAAVSADYATVMRLAGWARALSQLYDYAPGVRTKNAEAKQVIWTNPSESGIQPPSKITSKITDKKYPRFFRHGELLVKVSWSKREKKEYRHRAPYSVVKALVEAVARKGGGGRLFTSEELIPLYDSENGAEVPVYQVYLGISLLKETGLIDQHGRSGYSVPRLEGFGKSVESVCSALNEE